MATGNINLPDQAHGPHPYLGPLTFARKIARFSIRPELNPIQFLWTGVGESWPIFVGGQRVADRIFLTQA
jgi:hypothetical protein